MEKLKNAFKPGQSKDDEILYGSGSHSDNNPGKVAGEGSHFPHSSGNTSTVTPSAPVADTGDASSTTAVKHGIPGESQEATGYHPTSSSTTTTDPAYGTTGSDRKNEIAALASDRGEGGHQGVDSTHHQSTLGHGATGTTSTTGNTGLTENQGSTTTPIYNQYATTQSTDPHGSSTGAGLGAAGVGAAGVGAGAYAANRDHDKNAPNTSATEHTSSSTSAAPVAGAVGSDSENKSNVAYTGPVHDSAFLNKLDRRVKKVENTTGEGLHGEPIGTTNVASTGDASHGTHSYQPPTGSAIDSSRSQPTTSSNYGTAGTQDTSYGDNSRSAVPAAVGGAATGAAVGSALGAGSGHHEASNTGTSGVPSSSAYDTGASPRYTDTSSSGVPSTGATTGTGYGASSSGTGTGSHAGPIGTAVTSSSSPYSSQPVDPRVGGHNNQSDNSHHYGRDAAIGGTALGAAGAGYAAGKHHDTADPSINTGTTTSTTTTTTTHGQHSSGYDPSTGTGSHVAQESGLASGQGISSSGRDHVPPTGNTAPVSGQQTTGQNTNDHHYGRDAALGAGAVGAGGAAAYGLSRDNEPAQSTASHPTTTSGYDQQKTAVPSTNQTSTQPEYDSQQGQSHHGRDAALGAGAVGAAGAAAYGVDQEAERKRLEKEQHEHDKQLQKEHKQEEKAHEKEVKKEQKEAEKQQKKAEKEHEKELKKEEKKHEKAVIAAEKKEEKQHEKEAKKQEKEEEKLEREREKEAAKAEERQRKAEEENDGEEKKKKGGLLGFLHRDKHKDEDNNEDSHGKETAAGAAGAGTLAAGAGLASHERSSNEHGHERNRLHKEPPESVKQQQAQYAEAPQSGYASQVTGGTGTTALAQGDQLPGGSHATGAANKLDPNVADRGTTGEDLGAENSSAAGRQSSIVTDQSTGLPMDLSKGEHTGRGTDNLPGGSGSTGY